MMLAKRRWTLSMCERQLRVNRRPQTHTETHTQTHTQTQSDDGPRRRIARWLIFSEFFLKETHLMFLQDT